MIKYEGVQMGAVTFNSNRIWQIIKDGTQMFPNGIYVYSPVFPGSSQNFRLSDFNILNPSMANTGNMPLIASGETINGVNNYDIFRLYTPDGEGFSWERPSLAYPEWIGNPIYDWTNITGDTKTFVSFSFNWDSEKINNLYVPSMNLHSMVERNVVNDIYGNGKQEFPLYIYIWEWNRTVAYNLDRNLLHTIPAVSGTNKYTDYHRTNLITSEPVRYMIALAMRHGMNEHRMDLRLSFNISLM